MISTLQSKLQLLQLALHDDKDDLILELDREIRPLIEHILNYAADCPIQQNMQMLFICDLIFENAEDAALVRQYSRTLAGIVEKRKTYDLALANAIAAGVVEVQAKL